MTRFSRADRCVIRDRASSKASQTSTWSSESQRRLLDMPPLEHTSHLLSTTNCSHKHYQRASPGKFPSTMRARLQSAASHLSRPSTSATARLYEENCRKPVSGAASKHLQSRSNSRFHKDSSEKKAYRGSQTTRNNQSTTQKKKRIPRPPSLGEALAGKNGLPQPPSATRKSPGGRPYTGSTTRFRRAPFCSSPSMSRPVSHTHPVEQW